jgi:dTDP-3-amino-3,4,6-trideoxy-alpha-D-glucose transaminase
VIPISRPELGLAEEEAVLAVLRSGMLAMGRRTAEFEEAWAAYCGVRHAVLMTNGTVALEALLRGLGIGPGDEVILPTNSFIATAEAVSATGARPCLVDVEESTALMTAETVEPALTPYTRCLIPVHLYGRSVDMEPLLALARKRGIFVVEDACQAHGARYRGRPVGSLGDAGCFSFYPTKNLGAWGDGGAVVTHSSRLAERIRILRSHGEAERHRHEVPARTDRLDGLQAAILRCKLERLGATNRRRRLAGIVLRQALADGEVTAPPPAATDGDHVFHLFVVRSPERDQLRDHLGASGIASAIHYPQPIHLQPAYASLGMEPGSLPVAERLALESCSLPIFPSIEAREIELITAAVASFRPRLCRESRRAA